MAAPVSAIEAIEKAMEGVTHPDAPAWIAVAQDGRGHHGGFWTCAAATDESPRYIRADIYSTLARQAEALQRENAELRQTLAGDHEIKPLPEERLDEILEFEERFKMLGGAGDTASLDWATQCALINEAVLACRARALLGGSENAK